MPGQAAHGVKITPPLRTLADKVNWLISAARPADRAPYNNAEVAALIRKATGEPVSYTTIWKLRNGQAANPQMRLIEAMSRFFGVPPSFFFEDHDDNQLGILHEHVEILAMIRQTDITTAQLRVFTELHPEVRQLIINLATLLARDAARRYGSPGKTPDLP